MSLDPHRGEFSNFMSEFVSETDRAAVVLGAAKIDSLLCALLDRKLLPHPGSDDDLLEGDHPLATFSARIKACHRLGLIDSESAKLLHVFRKLRNGFAHETAQGSLNEGSARDRVLALADPFKKSDFFVSIARKIADDIKRDANDPGVLFRGVLAMFYMHLHHMKEIITPATAPDASISETYADAADPTIEDES